MTIKNSVAIALALALVVVSSILTASFVVYENNRIQNGQASQNLSNQSSSSTQSVIAVTDSGLTKEIISQHNTENDCWVIISGGVYSISSYLSAHPGGKGVIIPYCGKDATQAFSTKGDRGSHSDFAWSLLDQYKVGLLSSQISQNSLLKTTPATSKITPSNSPISLSNPSPTQIPNSNISLTTSEVAKHSTAQDCWTIVSGKVYNVTSYINSHPGGSQAVMSICGVDGTVAFQTKGGGGSHSQNAVNILSSFYVGDINTLVSVPPTQSAPPNPISTPQNDDWEEEDD